MRDNPEVLQRLDRLIELWEMKPSQVAAMPVQNVQNNDFEQPEHAQIARKKPSKQLQKALDWIAEHDPNCELTVREAATLADVSVGTMQKARESKND